MKDNLDILVQRLGRLLDVLESKEFGGSGTTRRTTTNNRDVTVRVDEPDDDNTPFYFASGANPLAVENTDEWQRVDLGLVAETVNIRTTDDILVAFSNPNKSGPTIRVATEDSPFTIGGSAGINAAFIWVKQASTATNTPEIQLIAYK